MNLRALATVAFALARRHATPPPAPALACLPPLARSCDHGEKKDDAAHAAEPALLPTVATLFNVHTREAIVLGATPDGDETERVARFLRDRTNWEAHPIAPECLATIRAACETLASRRVEVVSGYRSDKLNEMLRKKGHHVARHSQHTQGHAVDFRLVGVPTRALLTFVRRAHHGGIGFYPDSGFVHVDVGPVRRWNGE